MPRPGWVGGALRPYLHQPLDAAGCHEKTNTGRIQNQNFNVIVRYAITNIGTICANKRELPMYAHVCVCVCLYMYLFVRVNGEAPEAALTMLPAMPKCTANLTKTCRKTLVKLNGNGERHRYKVEKWTNKAKRKT